MSKVRVFAVSAALFLFACAEAQTPVPAPTVAAEVKPTEAPADGLLIAAG